MIDAAVFAEVLWPKLVEFQSLGDEPAKALLAGAVHEVQIDAMLAGVLPDPPWKSTVSETPENQVGRFFETDEGQLAFDLR